MGDAGCMGQRVIASMAWDPGWSQRPPPSALRPSPSALLTMSTQNWSMSITGYPAHARSGARVVGISHLSTFSALRQAEGFGLVGGWLFAEGAQPQLEGLRAGAPQYVKLTDLFSTRMVVQTEGLANGSLVFAAGRPEDGEPLSGRSLIAWAEAKGQPWVEVIDNEIGYWGGLDDARLAKLLTWFLCQRPLDLDWRKQVIEARTLAKLRHGLFEHGWTRNVGLAVPGRHQDLWAGIHLTCPLEHGKLPLPSRVSGGLRLRADLGEFIGRESPDRCPINDESGKARLLSGEF